VVFSKYLCLAYAWLVFDFASVVIIAEQLEGSTPSLIGMAIGIYGISQAILQIPFGLMSDRFGRKKIIIIGLILFLMAVWLRLFQTVFMAFYWGEPYRGLEQ